MSINPSSAVATLLDRYVRTPLQWIQLLLDKVSRDYAAMYSTGSVATGNIGDGVNADKINHHAPP
jgi:hypothetical protein